MLQGFRNHSTVSSLITGIHEIQIKRFHVILQVINCGFETNVREYEKYCLETAHMYD